MNVFFLVDTGSPCSYLCQEAMGVLIGKGLEYQPKQLSVAVQTECTPFQMHLSPLIGPDGKEGKFHDVNVLGMDFFDKFDLTIEIDFPLKFFKIFKKTAEEIYDQYEEDV